ncbi:AbrB family transcriptional regulator [Levilactobacillus yiduensis]|uniref:AbrB family transcriptional regulator n=1 Tax=Levilactobacillus yiduensis TaxID=2953880 RepID=UPI000EF2FB34|nr:AbrB family transcriptional regulator [Levilactobacillus yiduensis]AYM01695.1 AbrB family transcriptional regulator [Levilactobacillus brevis]
MTNPEKLNGPVKLVKTGNAYAFRLSKSDCEFLDVDGDTTFEKIISPDGKEITFRKIELVRANILATANELFDEHEDLMKRLDGLFT